MSIQPFDRQEEDRLAPASPPSREAFTGNALAVDIKRRLPGFMLDMAFQVPEGLTVLFGPSGSGKSLTLQSIAGLFPLDKAQIALGNLTLHDTTTGVFLLPQQRHIGYVPQNYALFPHLTVAQNIAFGRTANGPVTPRRVAELLRMMQLEGLEQRRPSQLSGGQQQRVALARALAVDPYLLLLDEPFSSLDAAVRERLQQELRSLYERVGVPMILVTHDAQEAQLLADHVVVVWDGHVLQVGEVQSVFRSPRSPAVAALVGMRTCVVGIVRACIPHTLETGQAPTTREIRQSDATTIAVIEVSGLLVQAIVPPHMRLIQGQQLTLGIRTDEVQIAPSEPMREAGGEPMGVPTLASGRVTRDRLRGPLHLITIHLAADLSIDVPVARREYRNLGLSAGSSVTVKFPLESVHIFDLAAEEDGGNKRDK
jgi:molybdate transport system ATP-binding protein